MCLDYMFQDRFLIISGSVLKSIWEPLGLPNGVYVEGFGWSVWGSILGWFLGGSGTPLDFNIQQNRERLGPGGGPVNSHLRQIADLRTQIT